MEKIANVFPRGSEWFAALWVDDELKSADVLLEASNRESAAREAKFIWPDATVYAASATGRILVVREVDPGRQELLAASVEVPEYIAPKSKPAAKRARRADADAADDAVIAKAFAILARRARKPGAVFTSPQMVRQLAQLKLGEIGHEVFAVMFLDAQHRLIEFREMFSGTLNQTSVYPREIVKAALALNAGAVVLTHNHPSGCVEPSRADEAITQHIKQALAFVDVRVLDHVVVSATDSVSFAERGLL